jgi:NAD(P)-dependent dehydrogenase (short-subunit alcohol dehydrogenase family)
MHSDRGRQVAVVMGGGNGIGAAACRLMAQRGWTVVVADRDEAAGLRVAEEIGGIARAIDVTDQEKLQALAAFVDAELGGAQALVVSSGSFQAVLPPQEIPAEMWNRIVDVNLSGTFHCNTAFGLGMARRGRGSIVNIASVTGMQAAPVLAYAASKAAVINLTQSLACEWGHAGVRVNAVSPGVTLVPRILEKWANGGGTRAAGDPGRHAALGRCVEPDEVAEAIEFLASGRSSAITGVNLPVDAGWVAASGTEMYGGPRTAPAQPS